MVIGIRVVLAMSLLAGSQGAALADQGQAGRHAQPLWKPAEPRALPALAPELLPANGAGCLVVGYYLLRDGTVAKPRVMQGAFTAGVPEAVQKTFAESTLSAALKWRFEYLGAPSQRLALFERDVIGFRLSADGEGPRVVIGPDAQDPRVATRCRLEDLAAWGERQAEPVADAPPAAGMLVPVDEPSTAFWIPLGTIRPPRYPADAYKQGIQGCVVLGIAVGSDGSPTGFLVTDSWTNRGGQGRKLLEAATMQAFAQLRFAPGPDNPRRLPALIQFPVDFALDRPLKNCAPVEAERLAAPPSA